MGYYFAEVTCKNVHQKDIYLREKTLLRPLSEYSMIDDPYRKKNKNLLAGCRQKI